MYQKIRTFLPWVFLVLVILVIGLAVVSESRNSRLQAAEEEAAKVAVRQQNTLVSFQQTFDEIQKKRDASVGWGEDVRPGSSRYIGDVREGLDMLVNFRKEIDKEKDIPAEKLASIRQMATNALKEDLRLLYRYARLNNDLYEMREFVRIGQRTEFTLEDLGADAQTIKSIALTSINEYIQEQRPLSNQSSEGSAMIEEAKSRIREWGIKLDELKISSRERNLLMNW